MAYQNRFARERKRQRAKFIGLIGTGLLAAGGLAGLGYAAWVAGSELAQVRTSNMETKKAQLAAERDAARAQAARADAAPPTLRQDNAAIQKRYDAEVPTGSMAEIYALVRQRLGAGVDQARLTALLRDAGPLQPCESRVLRKRHPIQVAPKDASDMAVFLDGLVGVAVAIPSAGAAPKQTATVTIVTAWTEEPVKLTGLPARRDIVINNAVLRLAVDVSEVAGFASVALSVCGKG